ncbi:hypothetical protein LR48_Vigan07g053200 [Vigna angularis]|uniref:Uncharacterized protein n=1 Tax=Phaseolus angularis TaxID=3914 RepID=A0A0L9UVP1_PHAAN|nr:hypothetical protein LR48_Vigan07g053200 [Vigna angularis]
MYKKVTETNIEEFEANNRDLTLRNEAFGEVRPSGSKRMEEKTLVMLWFRSISVVKERSKLEKRGAFTAVDFHYTSRFMNRGIFSRDIFENSKVTKAYVSMHYYFYASRNIWFTLIMCVKGFGFVQAFVVGATAIADLVKTTLGQREW